VSYNLLAVLILLGWIFVGVYTLDFLSGRLGENTKGRRWLNLAALFFGPVVLPIARLSLTGEREKDTAVQPSGSVSVSAVPASAASSIPPPIRQIPFLNIPFISHPCFCYANDGIFG